MIRFLGLILITLGALWVALSGLCTLVFAISFLQSGPMSDVGVALFVGIPSIAAGFALFLFGRYLAPRKNV